MTQHLSDGTSGTSARVQLADAHAPKAFGDVIGQDAVVAALKAMTRVHAPHSLCLYGPPGTGKTSLARVYAYESGRDFKLLNAIELSSQKIRETIADAADAKKVIYIDEVQNLTKKQQQELMPCIDDNRATLVLSTADNPAFCVYGPLLSRCVSFELAPLDADSVFKALDNAQTQTPAEVVRWIAHRCGGDMRQAWHMLDVAVALDADDAKSLAATLSSQSTASLDGDRDQVEDLKSALQKSIRGSDADAALFYAMRLLDRGELLTLLRRMQVCACEDVGLASPETVVFARACAETAREIGMPEARIPVADAVIALANAPKSNAAYEASNEALRLVASGVGTEIPVILRTPDCAGYEYPHAMSGRWSPQQYLPDDVPDNLYEPGSDREVYDRAWLDAARSRADQQASVGSE